MLAELGLGLASAMASPVLIRAAARNAGWSSLPSATALRPVHFSEKARFASVEICRPGGIGWTFGGFVTVCRRAEELVLWLTPIPWRIVAPRRLDAGQLEVIASGAVLRVRERHSGVQLGVSGRPRRIFERALGHVAEAEIVAAVPGLRLARNGDGVAEWFARLRALGDVRPHPRDAERVRATLWRVVEAERVAPSQRALAAVALGGPQARAEDRARVELLMRSVGNAELRRALATAFSGNDIEICEGLRTWEVVLADG